MAGQSYGAVYEFTIDLDTVANTRSYGAAYAFTIDLDTVANTHSYGAAYEFTIDLDTVANTRSYGATFETQVFNTLVPNPYYRCNTGSGTVLNDDSLAGLLDGVLTNAAIWSATGGPASSTCLDLNGSTYTGSVDTGSGTTSGINSVTNEFSFSLWARPDAAGGIILNKSSSTSDAQFILSVAATGVLTMEYEKSGNNYSLATSASAVNMSGVWQNIAVSVSDASPPVIKIYIDAVEAASGTALATVSASSANIAIGYQSSLGSNVVDPADGATATSGAYPGGEAPPKAIDGNNSTKYLNYAGAGTGIEIHLGASYAIGAIDLTSANDSPSRDPATWEITGSTDGVSFSAVASGSVSFSSRYDLVRNTFSGSASYEYYRVIFPTLVGGSYMQIAEIGLIEAITGASFDGRLDEIAFWPSYTITADDATDIYNDGTPPDLTNGIPSSSPAVGFIAGQSGWFE